MGSIQELILIDTNIFVVDLRYKREIHFKLNQGFLSSVAQSGSGFTTFVNLLELCGILSFNLKKRQLFDLLTYFEDRYKITVLSGRDMEFGYPLRGFDKMLPS